jgi:enoyl-CoA hydratase/carnithine racemase
MSAQRKKVVRFEQDGLLGKIVLCDPPSNFLGIDQSEDLRLAVHEASSSEIGALLIEAEGPNFNAGGAVHEWPGKSRAWFRTFVAETTSSYRAIEALPVPVVAAVRGELVGGGMELALCADFIIASENTLVWCVEINAGHVPVAGGVQRLASRAGLRTARRLVLFGEKTPITEVPEVADLIVGDDELDSVATEKATRLSKGFTAAYTAAKGLWKTWDVGCVAADKVLLDLVSPILTSERHGQWLGEVVPEYDARIRAEKSSAEVV